jgi:hypothetical protein
VDSAIDGLQGLAGCEYRPEGTNDVVNKILAQVEGHVD